MSPRTRKLRLQPLYHTRWTLRNKTAAQEHDRSFDVHAWNQADAYLESRRRLLQAVPNPEDWWYVGATKETFRTKDTWS